MKTARVPVNKADSLEPRGAVGEAHSALRRWETMPGLELTLTKQFFNFNSWNYCVWCGKKGPGAGGRSFRLSLQRRGAAAAPLRTALKWNSVSRSNKGNPPPLRKRATRWLFIPTQKWRWITQETSHSRWNGRRNGLWNSHAKSHTENMVLLRQQN